MAGSKRESTFRSHGLAWTAAALMGLAGCGGGSGSDTATPAPEAPEPRPTVPEAPVPEFTYAPDPGVCAWVAEYIKPFAWPGQTVGPRTWAAAQVRTAATPDRNAQGLILYRVTSNLWVLQAHYSPEIRARKLTYSPSQLWAQQASCEHGFAVQPLGLTSLGYTFQAYMPDATAGLVAKEEYTAGIEQVAAHDPCKPSVVFGGAPLPPGCPASP